MPEPDHFHANLHRGSLLLNQNRPKDALPYLQAAIAANPNDPRGYAALATCFSDTPGQRAKATGAIDRAIALAPQISFYQGRKAWFLLKQGRFQAALGVANKGLRLNPNCITSLNARANAQTKLRFWGPAAETCRHILSLNPNDGPALNLLAQALRLQGRVKESREVVVRLLARMPNNAFGHTNAGFAALGVGDSVRAHEHFRQALRIDPHFDTARRGLLATVRARSFLLGFGTRILLVVPRTVLGIFYFGSLIAAPLFFIPYFTGEAGVNAGFWIGLLFAVLAASMYLFLVGTQVANFALLFDPVFRHALKREEKIRACTAVAFLLVIEAGFVFSRIWLGAVALPALCGALVVSFQYPLLKDRWQRRREEAASS